MNARTHLPGSASHQRRPILVTGVPRSGTTWLARLLADAQHSALTGREPMNPRGRQYALGGTLTAWTRLEVPDSRQIRLLGAAYSGRNPLVYSRYGRRQWSAAFPWTQLIVKDPFAMLSMPAIVSVTNARPVLIYRHPGAVLASYRRMGWTADLEEIRSIISVPENNGAALQRLNLLSDVQDMAAFWTALHDQALDDIRSLPDALVLSHHEMASGGAAAKQKLFDLCGLRDAGGHSGDHRGRVDQKRSTEPERLHNFNRDSEEVAEAWRTHVSEDEVSFLDQVAAGTLKRLEQQRVQLR